ncbi:MAG TPA: Maf family protein [Myxococcales bacterium]|nr:Maf family protein [Myxococcales bacterium]
MSLVLASTSPARRALLDALGVPYDAVAPGVGEEVPEGTEVERATAMLARRKAEAVAKVRPGPLVLGADQLVELDGVALGKPPDATAALEQLRALSGRAHRIVTAVCLVGPGVELEEVDVVGMRLFALSEDELRRYVATGEWRGCAGGYRVEGRGQALFEDIQGDRTSVQGLPMLRVVRMLRRAGVALP